MDELKTQLREKEGTVRQLQATQDQLKSKMENISEQNAKIISLSDRQSEQIKSLSDIQNELHNELQDKLGIISEHNAQIRSTSDSQNEQLKSLSAMWVLVSPELTPNDN
jgi:hypothetical protein